MSFFEHRVPELLDEVVAMYRAAGRPLAMFTDDALDASFIDTVEAYIADPRAPARFRAVNDVAAEYVLRRRHAPVEQVVRLKEGTEIKAIDQPHKRKLLVLLDDLPGHENLPMIVSPSDVTAPFRVSVQFSPRREAISIHPAGIS